MSAPPRFASGLPDASAPIRATWTSHFFNTGAMFRFTYWLARVLPRPLARALAFGGTRVAHWTLRGTRAGVADNFRGAFPELSPAEIAALTRRTYHAYSTDVLDLFRSVSMTDAQALELFEPYQMEGGAFMDALAGGKGVILVTGHFGNWEIGGALMRALDLPMTIVAMREASEEINRLRVEFRQRFGADTIEVRQSMDTALQIRRRLSENRIVAMLMDRHVDRDRVPVTFFGRRAYFLRTPALLAYMTGAPLLPCSVVRLPSGRFRVRPGTPIHVPHDVDRDTAVRGAAQAFADQLEGCIRETPHAWYQFYDYWATQDAVVD
ncbi:MAG: lysophospholipid acyltransferase family protein [Vicinamibacteraceae bacterium]